MYGLGTCIKNHMAIGIGFILGASILSLFCVFVLVLCCFCYYCTVVSFEAMFCDTSCIALFFFFFFFRIDSTLQGLLSIEVNFRIGFYFCEEYHYYFVGDLQYLEVTLVNIATFTILFMLILASFD
jgi:hypothetical protein